MLHSFLSMRLTGNLRWWNVGGPPLVPGLLPHSQSEGWFRNDCGCSGRQSPARVLSCLGLQLASWKNDLLLAEELHPVMLTITTENSWLKGMFYEQVLFIRLDVGTEIQSNMEEVV